MTNAQDTPGSRPDLVVSDQALNDLRNRLSQIREAFESEGNYSFRVQGLGYLPDMHGGAFTASQRLSNIAFLARQRLVALMDLQQQAIELVEIATAISARGYQNVEEEQRRRLGEITAQFEELYAPPPAVGPILPGYMPRRGEG
ncbi:hypothetical protein RM780_25725 [Streptomyces sp. DSM 44917]|uniref:Uncharacterized protein n=1 Tax=Streptomyces boetiae TaxID=3075541 RepID=A0ABU2LFF7_9ACTN|nr:hypothetical protein [Streptomyces sp. DSM 44917]MDT0310323.1 hypothetical protein [Streptomyces sp. DSM 44917]